MPTIMVLAGLLATVGPALAGDGCRKCHSSEEMTDRGRRPALRMERDVHARAGISCAECHGGDPDTDDLRVAHSRKRSGFRGKASGLDIVAVCGECHDRRERLDALGAKDLPAGQPARFRGSVHGKVEPVRGFERPTCASCHGVHGILPPSDPASPVHPTRVPLTCARCHEDLSYMRAYTSARVRVDQLLEYRTSVHGRRLEEGDTKVAVCSSCHGSHDIRSASDPNSSVHPLNVAETCGRCHSDPERMKGYTREGPGGTSHPLPTDQLDRYRESVHYAALTERGDLSAPTCNDCHGNHGATPPEVRTVATVCAQCHSRPGELFGPSDLRRELDRLGFRECATCHGSHRIRHPDDGLLASIAKGRTVSGWVPSEERRAAARGFLASIRRLEARIREVRDLVERVERYGMDLTRARLKLNQARDTLVRSRVVIHAFDPSRMKEIVEGTEEEPGGLRLTAAAEELANRALAERSFRRVGLAVALAIILLVIAGLVVKIRRMEAAASPGRT